MPPVMGAVAFIMADFTNTEYGVIVIAAADPEPALLLRSVLPRGRYAARTNMTGRRRQKLPTLRQTISDGWPFLVVLLFLVWGLVFMRWERLTPFYASGLLIALTFVKKETVAQPAEVHGDRLRDQQAAEPDHGAAAADELHPWRADGHRRGAGDRAELVQMGGTSVSRCWRSASPCA